MPLESELEHWIDHPSDPAELVLAWRAPDAVDDRTRWAVGMLRKTPTGACFRYFDDEEFVELNGHRPRSILRSYGYAGYPAFDASKQPLGGFTENVLEAFARRLPPASRPDFKSIMEHYRVRSDVPLSTMSLLALTEAKLPSDGFSLIDRLDPAASCLEVVFEVAGHRHNAACRDRLAVGDRLHLRADPANEYDVDAVRVEASGELIGHVNRLQAKTVGRWLQTREVSAWLVRLNGKPDHPRAFAFVSVRPGSSSIAA